MMEKKYYKYRDWYRFVSDKDCEIISVQIPNISKKNIRNINI